MADRPTLTQPIFPPWIYTYLMETQADIKLAEICQFLKNAHVCTSYSTLKISQHKFIKTYR